MLSEQVSSSKYQGKIKGASNLVLPPIHDKNHIDFPQETFREINLEPYNQNESSEADEIVFGSLDSQILRFDKSQNNN